MKNIYFLFLMIVVVGMSEKTFAQSRWIGIMPMEFNPSFAGNTGGHRIVALGGYEHSGGRAKQTSPNSSIGFMKLNSPLASISYDNFIPKIGSGIGFYMSSRKYSSGSREDENTYTSFDAFKAGLIISPKISIRGKYTIAPSIGLNYKKLRYDYQPSELLIDFDSLNYKPEHYKSDIFYLTAGLLFNTENFYIGYAHYLPTFNGARQKNSFYEERYISHNKHNYYYLDKQYGIIQAGYKFQKSKDSKTSYLLQKMIWTNRKLDLITLFISNLSFVFKYRKVLLGISTTDHFLAGVGFQTSKIKIFYSQNLDYINYQYSGELSCRVLIPNKKRTFYQF
ncbi:hypothetical protein MYP_446 [Sporocytophaga myxococcoides]|uniref:Type IX secretion system membrane protein PorP/SprF n=1 Tax=Sporocytophaga myxococcoides TaxID=153721 RepID=A0A098L8N3_9BACT|nr:hypothetical protein [Sporocytophaga myxococcoides]GAL83220.1 hypothetical protein MYP_446 [Sporocytophaga myxococcoides]